MISREITDDDRALWSRYFRCTALLAIAQEYNAKTWPVDRSTDVDTAQYIGAFCYVFDLVRARERKEAAK